MRKYTLLIAAIVVSSFASSELTPAFAQAARTWVSGVGTDSGTCPRTAPCASFAYAITQTNAGGEINCLDAGGYGGLTITKSISIVCSYTEAGVLVSGTNGITINAGATDSVVLEGLDLDGTGTGLNGVNILAGKNIYIIRCTIRRFTQNGVNMTSTSSGARAFVKDSFIMLNGGGVNVQGNGVGNTVGVLNSIVDNNTNFAIQANGSGNFVSNANNILSNSQTVISALNGGVAVSFGPSNIVAGTGNTFTTTTPFK